MSNHSKKPSAMAGATPGERRPFWIVDGKAYDFSEWKKRHPGGAFWFKRTEGRDISVLFHIIHRRPERLQAVLERYRIEGISPEAVFPRMGLPPFLLAPDFEAARDLPRFDFQREDSLLKGIQRSVEARLPDRRLKRWDTAFDLVVFLFLTLHLAALGALVLGGLPPWACGALWVFTRTALAGGGHYHLHRKKPNLGDALFDLNYVGTCLIGFDGHVLLHHPYLGSGADVKRTFFDGMMCVHPLFRIVGYTLHKLGVCLTGMPLRGIAGVVFQSRNDRRPDFWLVRAWLLLELGICAATGHLVFWFFQFLVTLWYNTFLVVASHDFERPHKDEAAPSLPAEIRGDWAAQQIFLSYDLRVTGIRWVDVFLTAGLSPHRVHHVLPAQRSGFANIASESAVREACEKAGLVWQPPKHLFRERFPPIVRRFLLAPAQRPEAEPYRREKALTEVKVLARYVAAGCLGVGAI